MTIAPVQIRLSHRVDRSPDAFENSSSEQSKAPEKIQGRTSISPIL
jgi:hypothetical protein